MLLGTYIIKSTKHIVQQIMKCCRVKIFVLFGCSHVSQRSRVMSEMLKMKIFFKKEFKLPTGR